MWTDGNLWLGQRGSGLKTRALFYSGSAALVAKSATASVTWSALGEG